MKSPLNRARVARPRTTPRDRFKWLSTRLALAALAMMTGLSAMAAELRDVGFAALPGGKVEIQLNLSGPVEAPETFATESPARIAMDLPGVTSKLDARAVPIGVGAVHSLVAVEASDRTRVVLNLTDPVPYEVSTSGNQITIKVDNGGAIAAAMPPAPLPPAQPRPQSAPVGQPPSPAQQAAAPSWSYPARERRAAAAGPPVRDIDFRRGASGEGRIMIRLPNANSRVAVREQASRVYIDLYETSLPQRLFRRLDVVDFGTPVTAVESRPNGSNVEIEVQTEGDFDYMAYQTDEIFTLDFRPLTSAEKEDLARQKVVYEGDRLSLNFQDIEVRAVLQVLADFTDLNLVASDSVQGNITLRLKNVPWDQALDIILKTKGLSMRQNGNVIMVAPTQELAAQEQLELESQNKIAELAPLRTEFIQINYARASDIAALLQGTADFAGAVAARDGGAFPASSTRRDENFNVMASRLQAGLAQMDIGAAGGILSARGSVTFDERTNTLIVQDTLQNLEAIRGLINLLDVPVRQVMIESRVVTAESTFARDLGVRFGVSGSMGSFQGNELLVGGGQDGNMAMSGFDAGPFGLNTATGTRYNSVLTDDAGNATLITNLPADPASGSINFLMGKVGSYLLQLELSAMQREGRGEVISSPRVITSDKQEATIKVGSEIPYQAATGMGNTTVSFKEAVLQLKVTPHITPDDRINMELEVNRDTPNYSREVLGVPPVDTQAVETNVLVDNGETVVLGGVFEREKTFNKEQVPWVGDLPLIGRLFKTESRTDNNSELLIFVTPKILNSEIVQR
ncbi:type IV pilus secretin PilQ [Thiorhodococcus mannitoliphagus]|uniref:Type IV pilus secretin PilQ n=1 Tax=Thiorhodococcus mannitoliphagus TaxID=329406 RepID=A0A6P1DL19_9GAMM|nr:type IV pilus secretin PilQ [Thiorhodococcus mannitoliphagus]NEX18728.1 type IV pilus secretin PilQ [Thiorhodococcus mannitoliphagus]